MEKRFVYACALCTLLCAPARSDAQIVGYTDRPSFDAAIAGLGGPTVFDFESLTTGTALPSGSEIPGSGLTPVYTIDGGAVTMQVANNFDTTSPTQFLGTNESGNLNQFVAGDGFVLNFASAKRGFGLYVISSDPLMTNDLQIVTSLGSVSNAAAIQATLPDGGLVYFLGAVTSSPISSATIQFDPGATGAFLFGVDDIVTAVPEPGSFVLAGIGAIASWGFRRVRRANLLEQVCLAS